MFTDNLNNLFNTQQLNIRTVSHLNNVYLTMFLGLLTTAFTCFVGQNKVHFLSSMLSPLFITQIGLILYMMYSQSKKYKKICFYTFSALEGLMLVPLVFVSNIIDETIVISAIALTSLTFGVFTIISLRTNKRDVLYFGGFLGSVLTGLMIMGIMNLYFQSELIFEIRIYLGLLLFSLYVMYDTQLIISDFERGNDDIISHAMHLYLDFINIFIRILVILTKSSKKKRNK